MQNGHLYDLDARTGDDELWEPIAQGDDVLGGRDDYEDLGDAAARLAEERTASLMSEGRPNTVHPPTPDARSAQEISPQRGTGSRPERALGHVAVLLRR